VNNHELSKIDFELIGDAIMKRLFAGPGRGARDEIDAVEAAFLALLASPTV
jgi:hypothetical protein